MINNFEVTILKSLSKKSANEKVNNFIENCNIDGINILDMTSHIMMDIDDYYSYIFVFKIENKRSDNNGRS